MLRCISKEMQRVGCKTVEDQLPVLTWEILCELLSKHFDKGQYQLLYRQLFKLRQTKSVGEYVGQFNTLMHHMLAYKPDLDPTFFTTRFIDGLATPIKAVVMIQRPASILLYLLPSCRRKLKMTCQSNLAGSLFLVLPRDNRFKLRVIPDQG